MAEGIMRLGTMGWLVLSGRPPEIGDRCPKLGEKILELTDLSKTPVYMTIGEMQDRSYLNLIEDLEILFGCTLKIIDLKTLPAEELRELWLDSSLKILGGGTVEEWYKILGVDLFKVRPEEILPEASARSWGEEPWKSGTKSWESISSKFAQRRFFRRPAFFLPSILPPQ
jgi:hypothetical protein